MYIYEAGCLTYLHKNNMFQIATEWRDKLDQWALDNNSKTFNPCKTFLKERNHTYSGTMVVKQNDFYLTKSNIAVVQMDYLDYSPGTIYELVNFKTMNKPVIAFGEKHWSPHINSTISEYCSDIEEVIILLSNMFIQ